MPIFIGVAMIFRETCLRGAYVIDIERHTDERGFFARTWCRRELAAHELEAEYVQGSISLSSIRGTVRGLHFQREPHSETKIVQCVRGAIYDVIVDLRLGSPTFRQWFGVELVAESYRQLYVPAGFAHGFQTLEDDTEVSYVISAFYVPGAARGIRYDDPALAIPWPMKATSISQTDLNLPALHQLPEILGQDGSL